MISGKSYYYLRISKRTGKQVITKDIAYLGNDIKGAREKIMNLPKYKGEIRKSYRKINLFLEAEYYLHKAEKLKLKQNEFLDKQLTQIEAIRLHYLENFKKEDLRSKEEIIKNFAINFAYNTTSIEGNTITLKEAQNLLEEGKTPKNKTLREIYDVQNTEATFIELLTNKQKISQKLIETIHKKLMANIDKRIGYRIKDIRVLHSHFDSTPGSYVRADMNLLIDWYKKNEKELHPLVLASLFHHKFEKIHPFSDGNGRTGRMMVNFILMDKGYPPMIIYKKDRSMYLDALSSADKINITKIDKKYKELVEFMSGEMISSYWSLFL